MKVIQEAFWVHSITFCFGVTVLVTLMCCRFTRREVNRVILLKLKLVTLMQILCAWLLIQKAMETTCVNGALKNIVGMKLIHCYSVAA